MLFVKLFDDAFRFGFCEYGLESLFVGKFWKITRAFFRKMPQAPNIKSIMPLSMTKIPINWARRQINPTANAVKEMLDCLRRINKADLR